MKKVFGATICCVIFGVVGIFCVDYCTSNREEGIPVNGIHPNLVYKMKKENALKSKTDTVEDPEEDEVTVQKVLEGGLGSCPWVDWQSGYREFKVSYPYFMRVNKEYTHDDGLVVKWRSLKMIAKMYNDKMSVEEKYEALKSGATTSSMGDDYFLLAGKMWDDMRFFEKDIKGDGVWYYLRVEFPVELTTAIDPLLHYVKGYQQAKAIMR